MEQLNLFLDNVCIFFQKKGNGNWNKLYFRMAKTSTEREKQNKWIRQDIKQYMEGEKCCQ